MLPKRMRIGPDAGKSAGNAMNRSRHQRRDVSRYRRGGDLEQILRPLVRRPRHALAHTLSPYVVSRNASSKGEAAKGRFDSILVLAPKIRCALDSNRRYVNHVYGGFGGGNVTLPFFFSLMNSVARAAVGP